MANDLNQCSFIGRLGSDVEMRYMPSGDAVASFSIAVGSQWKDKTSGEKKESVEWVNITAFGKLGEICGEYLRKGSQVYVSGRLKTEKYQAKDGTDRYSTKVIAENMQMLGSRQQGGDHEQADPSRPVPAAKPAGNARPDKPPSQGAGAFENFDDEIPF